MVKYHVGDYIGDNKHLILEKKGRKSLLQCGLCGKKFEAYTSSVALNQKKSCGCLKDLSGKRFGKLVVIENTFTKNNQNAYYWRCKCDCGKETLVSTGNLQSGHTTSCGCAHKDAIQKQVDNYVGSIFGKLTVIQDIGKRSKNGTRIWLCKCECGSMVEVSTNHLNNGHTTSCGCISSKGELKIANLLKKLGISFNREKWFKECRNPKTNQVLYFDFYLPDYNTCIEYDGEQHCIASTNWGGEEAFESNLYRDNIKNQYCKDNDIKLIRIPYWDYNNLNAEYLKEALKEGE